MKATELDLKKEGYHMSGNSFNGKYKLIMSIGRCLPKTKDQAKYFYSLYKNYGQIDVLNYDDVEKIEAILNKHGFKGNYKYTKSKQ